MRVRVPRVRVRVRIFIPLLNPLPSPRVRVLEGQGQGRSEDTPGLPLPITTDGGREEDAGGIGLPEEEETELGFRGRNDEELEEVCQPANRDRGKGGGGMSSMSESTEGPTWSSAPSSSVLMMLSIAADWEPEDKLPGLNAWVQHGWVPGIKFWILQ
jgi:hypothetical protein